MTIKLTAAYMAIGLIQAPNQLQVQDAWPHGQIELLGVVLHYADYLTALGDAGHQFCEGSPGVFEYEVVEDAGAWFGQYLLDNAGVEPDTTTFCAHLKHVTQEFFLQCFDHPSDGTRIGLEAVLQGIPLPAAP